MAQYYVQNILDNTLSPLVGARKMWFEICNEIEIRSERLFDSRTISSEIEDLSLNAA